MLILKLKIEELYKVYIVVIENSKHREENCNEEQKYSCLIRNSMRLKHFLVDAFDG